MTTRVLIADDQDDFRLALAALLDALPLVDVVDSVADGAAAIAACARHRPDVVLMDVRMPELDGVSATRELALRFPAVRVIMLTTFHDDDLVRNAIAAGAAGYALKGTSAHELGEVIAMTQRGYAAFAPGIRLAHALADDGVHPAAAAAFARLTERERAILREMATGATNRDIARTFFITEGTVKNYVTRILARLGVRSRTEAALVARHLRR